MDSGLDSVPVSPSSTNGPRTMVPVMPMKQVRRGSHGSLPKLPPMTQVRKGSLGSIPSVAGTSVMAPQSEMITQMQFTATPRTNGNIGVSNHGRSSSSGSIGGVLGHMRTIDGGPGVG